MFVFYISETLSKKLLASSSQVMDWSTTINPNTDASTLLVIQVNLVFKPCVMSIFLK